MTANTTIPLTVHNLAGRRKDRSPKPVGARCGHEHIAGQDLLSADTSPDQVARRASTMLRPRDLPTSTPARLQDADTYHFPGCGHDRLRDT